MLMRYLHRQVRQVRPMVYHKLQYPNFCSDIFLLWAFSHFISILHCPALLYVTIYTYYHTALNTVRNTAYNVFFIWMFAYKTQASICFVFILELSLSYYQRPTLPYIPYFLKENVTAPLFCHLQALQARPLLLRYYSLPH